MRINRGNILSFDHYKINHKLILKNHILDFGDTRAIDSSWILAQRCTKSFDIFWKAKRPKVFTTRRHQQQVITFYVFDFAFVMSNVFLKEWFSILDYIGQNTRSSEARKQTVWMSKVILIQKEPQSHSHIRLIIQD